MPRTGWPSHDSLNALARRAGLNTESGKAVRFVPPAPADPYYEVHVFQTGEVHTRLENWHDLFNALAWLAFPRTKAAINALHAAAIPRERGRRGRLRDMLTLFDEGGAIVVCADPELEEMIRGFRWKEVFWQQRARARSGLRFLVLGHAVLEKALDPWPGITCKALFVGPGDDADAQASHWLAVRAANATPRDLAPLPVFGFPGWLPGSDHEAFYGDERYFRPFSKNRVRPTVPRRP